MTIRNFVSILLLTLVGTVSSQVAVNGSPHRMTSGGAIDPMTGSSENDGVDWIH